MTKPLSIARQSRHATGLLGWVVAQVMARETRTANERAISELDCNDQHRVLDLGCGHGRAMASLARRCGHVTGVDTSGLMVRLARRHNARAIREGRAEVHVASAARLPFAYSTFDKVLCVHVIYFWQDMQQVFCEISRVTRPGGTLALVFRDSLDQAAVSEFPSEIYRFPDVNEVVDGLASAGFSVEARPLMPSTGKGRRPINLVLATRRER